ncbi:uncharacterized protein MELLADRAFT_105583 [Melampsora larici-populina 98AG31]|uniref:Uncharacterized protein n=1 Tax=Melampsora larici-populina (strain 98AG31 / pathotype 3-4-7) TaxID=747676 RepID=F4RIP9_MELLP|nr:uncharacterized protein MELLADRAFT_105589 [Melampsora larici-populina 98AG31]XP_007409126.1 uncharacterized protein MELLADRAFT_105583 [Melampsora larici-populina 98AG31]EGG07789.1 hypothetical protein MELLADRAFT_105589 [Melampsora larici-populina 98AG31]EGG07794.1 hypothetical protein MELLADRAFT_105583 [Melampsora larici-populina 98AG31]
MNMRPCKCSQCDPHGCARILRLLPTTKHSDFGTLMSSSPEQPEDVSLFSMPKKITKRKFSGDIPLVCKRNDPIRLSLAMIDLAVILVGEFEGLFQATYPNGSHMHLSALFDREEAWQVVKNYEAVKNGTFLREILGGETLPGHFVLVRNSIHSWIKSPVYHKYQQDLEDERIRQEQAILDSNLIEEEHQEQMRLKQIESDIKKAGIAERKRIRLQKAIDKQRAKEEKLRQRQEELLSVSSSSDPTNSSIPVFLSFIDPQMNREGNFFLASSLSIFLSLPMPSNSMSSTSSLSSVAYDTLTGSANVNRITMMVSSN